MFPLAADSSGAVRASDGHLLPLARLWSGWQEYLYLACSLHRCFVCDSVLNSEHRRLQQPAASRPHGGELPRHLCSCLCRYRHVGPGPHSSLARCVLAAGCAGATARSAASPAQLDGLQLVDNAGPKRQMRDRPSADSVAKCAAYHRDAPRRPHSSLATRPSPADLCVPFKSPNPSLLLLALACIQALPLKTYTQPRITF